jgi:pSer/pThr/pTyr-binding forkhead associated (FHA) protein
LEKFRATSECDMSKLFLFNQSRLLNPPRFRVATGIFIVGRSSGCDLVVRHASVSRRHAEIQVLGECVTVVDLESRNGTYIDGQRIESGELSVGHKVTFGGVPFVLLSEESADEPADSSMETADHRDRERTAIPSAVANRLSWAQRRVLVQLLEGLSEKEAAEKLNLSPHTVHNHVRDIYSTLNVHSRAELLALLLKN